MPTVSEAKTRWCPFASSRAISFHSGPMRDTHEVQYLGPADGVTVSCIGDNCMAWRRDDARMEELYARVATPEQEADWQAGRTGYCGLAGPVR